MYNFQCALYSQLSSSGHKCGTNNSIPTITAAIAVSSTVPAPTSLAILASG
jgi:hypothetical protein